MLSLMVACGIEHWCVDQAHTTLKRTVDDMQNRRRAGTSRTAWTTCHLVYERTTRFQHLAFIHGLALRAVLHLVYDWYTSRQFVIARMLTSAITQVAGSIASLMASTSRSMLRSLAGASSSCLARLCVVRRWLRLQPGGTAQACWPGLLQRNAMRRGLWISGYVHTREPRWASAKPCTAGVGGPGMPSTRMTAEHFVGDSTVARRVSMITRPPNKSRSCTAQDEAEAARAAGTADAVSQASLEQSAATVPLPPDLHDDVEPPAPQNWPYQSSYMGGVPAAPAPSGVATRLPGTRQSQSHQHVFGAGSLLWLLPSCSERTQHSTAIVRFWTGVAFKCPDVASSAEEQRWSGRRASCCLIIARLADRRAQLDDEAPLAVMS